jgi:hypothetical protein
MGGVSDFTTTCPECGSPFVAVGPVQTGSMQPNEKPDAVTCTGEERHKFPVLEREITAGNQPRYKLGDLVEDDEAD